MNKPRARVLIVDDSAMVRALHAYILQTVGFDTIEAENGFTALEMLRQWHCDVAVVDMNMPRMDGLTLIKELRALPSYKCVPILVLTTESGQERKMLGKEAGATGWLVKPFSAEQLMATVARLM